MSSRWMPAAAAAVALDGDEFDRCKSDHRLEAEHMTIGP